MKYSDCIPTQVCLGIELREMMKKLSKSKGLGLSTYIREIIIKHAKEEGVFPPNSD